MISKTEMTEKILNAKHIKGLSLQAIADNVGKDVVWVTSALMGQNTMDLNEAKSVTSLLSLGKDVEDALQVFPMKGSLDIIPPTDPLIYRLYEIVLVYGTTMKAVINEKLGDGIMSAIDFSMNIEKVENPAGDRVKVTMNGKFLPYKKW